MDAGAVGLKIGLEVLRRTAPTGIAWLRTYVRGIELLILGPAGAGKTSMAEYFEFGFLEESQPHEKTLEITVSTTFEIAVGRDQALKLRIRRNVDVPGQTGPVQHANLIRERRPHAILIVLDGSRCGEEIAAWLNPFLERFDYLLRKDKRLHKRIRGIFVAMNKYDLIRRAPDYSARHKRARNCLVGGLSEVLSRQVARAIPILPTVAVQTQYETRLVDALIRRIAKQVAK